jgi:hypothetical protein
MITTKEVVLGTIYTLTDHRGAAEAVEICDRFRLKVRFADGRERKLNVCSLSGTAEVATNEPASRHRAPDLRRIEGQIFRAAKSRWLGEYPECRRA